MIRILAAVLLLLALVACETAPQQGATPRGFPQPGSPFPYNSPGW